MHNLSNQPFVESWVEPISGIESFTGDHARMETGTMPRPIQSRSRAVVHRRESVQVGIETDGDTVFRPGS